MRNISFISILMILTVACSQQSATKSGSADLAPNSTTTEGTINGGGGVGIQCGDHIEMLDIYEARQAGLKLVDLPASEDAAIQLVSSRIAEHFWNIETIPVNELAQMHAKNYIGPIFQALPIWNIETKKQEDVEYVNSLPLSNDLGKVTPPAGCSLVQIAYFSDSKTKLSIVKPIWDKLDLLSKGFLAAHEVIYLFDRRDSIENLLSKNPVHSSQLTRKFVGQLFSDTPPVPESNGVPSKENVYRCAREGSDNLGTYFYAFENKRTGKLSLVFNAIYDHNYLYQMRADFNKLTLSNVIGDSGEAKEVIPLKFTGVEQASGFEVAIEQKTSVVTFQLLYSHQKGPTQKISCSKFD